MAADKDSESIVFAQVDANLDSNPKIRKAGALGRAVFEFLLRRNALRGFKGSVPAAFIDPDYLADILMLSASDAVTAVTKAVTANLIAIDDDGDVRIVGWHESWGRRAKAGKERTAKWRAGKDAKEQDAVTTGDVGDETPSRETTGDESDAKRREEKRDPEDIHTRAHARPPAAAVVARSLWSYGAKIRAELAQANVAVPPWALLVGTDHAGWTSLLDRVCERLVDSTPELAEQTGRNRINVAAAKAREDGDGNWFSPRSLFTRKSFDAFAELDPKQFGRKSPKKRERKEGELIGSSTPHADYPDDPNPHKWSDFNS